MLPGNAELVICPYCGTKKELMTLMSGNTFGAEYWSDNKEIAPMLPKVSPVQKCPHCGKYYLKHKQDTEEGDDYTFDLGTLSYPEWKEAYSQFTCQHAQKVKDKHTEITDDDLNDMEFLLIQAYNDYYHRNKVAEPSEKEYIFFCWILNRFIEGYDWSSIEAPLLKAEFYREANEMKKCAEVLRAIPYDMLEDYEKGIYDGIKDRMEKNDIIVFQLFV